MTTAILQKKIFNMEAELTLLKKSIAKEPDFNIDERNWEKIKPLSKKIRLRLFKKRYG